jgi:hypothetical protein
MAHSILMDELHVTIRAPVELPEADYQAMHRALHRPRLLQRVRQAVTAVLQSYLSLRHLRIRLSR